MKQKATGPGSGSRNRGASGVSAMSMSPRTTSTLLLAALVIGGSWQSGLLSDVDLMGEAGDFSPPPSLSAEKLASLAERVSTGAHAALRNPTDGVDSELAEAEGAPAEGEGRVAPAAAGLANVAAVAPDPTDPLGSGLAEAPPPDGYRSELERSWFSGGISLGGRASAARVRALELGASDAAGPTHALIAPAGAGGELGEAMLAVRLSPDLPLAHASLAAVYWKEGERAEAVTAFLGALRAIPRNLEAVAWFASSGLAMFVAVLAAGALAFMVMAGLAAFPRAAHDIGDLFGRGMPAFARAALLGALLLVPFALGEGLLGFAVALFALGVAYGTSGHRVALGLSATLLVLALYPLAELSGRTLRSLSADPVASAVLSVVQGVESEADLARLRREQLDDSLAAHGLAIHARRTGHLDEAYRRYQWLLEAQPRNPIVMTNLANLEFHRGAVDEAIGLYERASQVLDSPVLWFNLSQAYARSFRMEEFEHALRRAQTLGADVVAELSAQKDPSLIADLALPTGELRSRMFGASTGAAFASSLRAPFAPGHFGARWHNAAIAFGGALALAVLLAGRFERAGTCGRCGVRICARCDGTVWNSLTCENCHRIFNHPESTDAALRAARVAELRSREARVERLGRAVSLLVPGFGGMFARRPDLAFLALLLFGWAVVAWTWRGGVVPDPLVVGAAGSVVFAATAGLAALLYAGVVFAGLVIRRNL